MSIGQDLVHSVRLFRRSPWFFAGIVLTLALGIGANGAVFSIVRAVLLQPLPYRDPARLAIAWIAPAQPSTAARDILRPVTPRGTPYSTTAATLHSSAGDVLESATYRSWQGNLEAQFDVPVGDHTERLRGALTTANFFEVLGVNAAAGRVFTAADESSPEPVMVLSYALWRRAYGADPNIIGQTVTWLADRPRQPRTYRIIGVLPASFRFTYPLETEAWTTLPWSDVRPPSTTGYSTVVRLKDGVTLETARARVATFDLSDGRPNLRPEDRRVITLEPITDWIVAEARPSLVLLSAVAGLLLIITCVTVAGALLVRVAAREREMAVRAAIGAGRTRLLGQLLIEGALLSGAGATAGTVIAVVAAPLLHLIVPDSVPRADEIGVNAWIIVFFGAASVAATLLAALAPAYLGSRVDLVAALKRDGRASVDRAAVRWRQVMIGLQAAVATTLLLGAALLIVSFWRLSHVPLGFDGTRVFTAEMRLLAPKYAPVPIRPEAPNAGPPPIRPSPALLAFQDGLVSQVKALPGVAEAGITSAVPFRGVDFVYRLDRADGRKSVAGNARFVDSAYFSAMKIPLVRGRVFGAADTLNAPKVMVISESYARAMFGSDDPIGQVIEADRGALTTVVGVVADLRYKSYDSDPYPAIYFSRSQTPSELICIVARLSPGAGNIDAAVRRIVHDLDPDVPAMNISMVDDVIRASIADRRFYASSTAVLAALALALTTVGLFVVITRAVAERRMELAIRTALGAPAGALVRSVAIQGVWPVAAGTAAGLAAAFLGAAAMSRFLFHTSPRSMPIFGGVAAFVVLIGIAAALISARGAAAVQPGSVLHGD